MNASVDLGLNPLCQRTLDHLSALVRIWTPEEGVVYVNRAWRDLTGTTLDQNAGDRWLSQVYEEDRAAVLLALGSAAGAASSDYRLVAKDGTAVPVRDTASVSLDERSGQLAGVVHTVTRRDDTGQADPRPAMSKWAHELRGPLNAILGWSDLLGHGDSDSDVVQRGLKAIANNARQQAAIIKRMTE